MFDPKNTGMAQWSNINSFGYGNPELVRQKSDGVIAASKKKVNIQPNYEVVQADDTAVQAYVSAVRPVKDLWAKRANYNYKFVVLGKDLLNGSGYLQCDFCAYLEPVAAVIDLTMPVTIAISSEDLILGASYLVSRVMPETSRSPLVRLLYRQAFRTLRSLSIYALYVRIEFSFLRTDIADGHIQSGDIIQSDLNMQFESETLEVV